MYKNVTKVPKLIEIVCKICPLFVTIHKLCEKLANIHHDLVHIAPVVPLLDEGDGRDGEGCAGHQGVAHPHAGAGAHRGDEEDEEEDCPNKVEYGSQEACQCALIDGVGKLYLVKVVMLMFILMMLILVILDLTVISKKRGEHELVALWAMMMAA